MIVLFTTNRDPRKRAQNFISLLHLVDRDIKPVELVGIYSSLSTLFSMLKKSERLNLVFFYTGFNLKSVLFLVLSLLFRIKIMLRLGGDPYVGRLEFLLNISNLFRVKMYIKILFDLLFNFVSIRNAEFIFIVGESMRGTFKTSATILVTPQLTTQEKGICTYTPQEYHKLKRIKFLTVGNFSYAKKRDGLHSILTMLDHCVKENTKLDFSLSVVGISANQLNLNAYSSDLISRVSFNGFVNNVKEFYDEANVFLYYSNYDVSPNVVVDAMCKGLPILINDAPFSKNFHYKDCGLLACNDVEFSKNIQKILNNQLSLKKLSRDSKFIFKKLFSYNSLVLKYQYEIKKIT